jgi:hypothetical protein
MPVLASFVKQSDSNQSEGTSRNSPELAIPPARRGAAHNIWILEHGMSLYISLALGFTIS